MSVGGRFTDSALVVGFEEKARTIFGANYERLIELKGKYDPGNMFSKGHLLGPQLDAWNGGVPVV